MTDWSLVFLGAIALATLTMAVIQVGVIVYAGRLKWRMDRLAETVEQDLKPLMGRLKEMSGDAARVTSLAVAQAERVDQLFAEFSQRSDHILSLVQNAVVVPAREGMAVLEGLRAGLAALRSLAERRASQASGTAEGVEDEEALFIG